MIPESIPTGLHPLLYVLLVIVGMVAVPMGGVWVAKINSRQKGHGKVLEEVRDQVSNDHSSNMRDDIDRIDGKVDSVDTKVDRLDGKFDLLTSGIEEFMRETRAATARQDRIAARYHPEEG